jgi:uncharacterized protein YlxW (UPF0749 family)
MTTQARVERELEHLIDEADDVAYEITVALRETQALLAVELQHLAQKIAQARLLVAQETARMIRSRLDTLRSVIGDL